MDCLCCDGGKGPATDSEFLGSLCNLKDSEGVEVKFPAEPNRYVMYVVAGCPFAARPWTVLGLYGLIDTHIKVIKCFPASYEDGWFLEAKSQGEIDLVEGFPEAKVDAPHIPGIHHVSELYYKANPKFSGTVSVPLLWDTKTETAVSNSSLGLAKMVATQMRTMATRNADLNLFPENDTEHDELIKMIHNKITTAVYKVNSTKDGRVHDDLVDDYYKTLDEFQEQITKNGDKYLMGEHLRFADIVLFISLVRLDLAYQWRFGLGRKNVRENYPGLWAYKQRIMKIPGVIETVLPRDIMALYFMTLKWVRENGGRTLPQVPATWEEGCMSGNC